MEVKQFVQIYWNNKEDFFLKVKKINNNSYEFFNILNKKISIKKLDKKYCIGGYNLSKRLPFPCSLNTELTDSKYSRCYKCENLTGFKLCLFCKGYKCDVTDITVLNFCKDNHYVYLAYFPNKIKVGTAAEYRIQERLMEQGAVFSILIAKSDGETARKIESTIASFGIVSQVNTSYKINNLYYHESSENIYMKLLNKFNTLSNDLPLDLRSYLITPKFNPLNKVNSNIKMYLKPKKKNLSLFDDYETEEDFENVYLTEKTLNSFSGIVKMCIGSILILEDNNKLFALDTKYLSGWLISMSMD